MKIQIHLERGGKGAPDLVNLVENEEEVEEGSVRDEIHGAPLITPEDTPEYLRLVERNMAADQVRWYNFSLKISKIVIKINYK